MLKSQKPNRNHKILAIIVVAIVIVVASAVYYLSPHFASGIKKCPQVWWSNRMPGPGMSDEEISKGYNYMIIDGERVQEKEVNVSWVKRNCEIKEPQIVE